MVVFEETTVAKTEKVEEKKTQISSDTEIPRITALEQELSSTKEYLQTTIEELETTNEELKSTNEELQSTNEELQSTNEELETSREELQSTNEELETVNSELQNKVTELSYANNDLNNLLGSTEIGTIFLDMDLNIKRFTPSMTELFNLRNSDIGRPITDITSNIPHKTFYQDTKKVLDTLERKKIEIETLDGKFYSMNILPYRTTENVIDGVVVTFVDITERIKSQQEINSLAKFPEENPSPVMRISGDGSVSYSNNASKALLETWNYSQGQQLSGEPLDMIKSALQSNESKTLEAKCQDVIYLVTFAPVTDSNYVNLYALDITDRKETEDALKKNEKMFRAIFEQSPMGVAIIDSKSCEFMKINTAYCQIVGYSEEEMLNSDFKKITHPDDVQSDLDNMDLLLNGEIDLFKMDKRYLHKDGAIVWVNLTVVPLWEGQEKNRYHVAIIEDVTERKQARPGNQV